MKRVWYKAAPPTYGALTMGRAPFSGMGLACTSFYNRPKTCHPHTRTFMSVCGANWHTFSKIGGMVKKLNDVQFLCDTRIPLLPRYHIPASHACIATTLIALCQPNLSTRLTVYLRTMRAVRTISRHLRILHARQLRASPKIPVPASARSPAA